MEGYYRKYITILFSTIIVFCIFTTAYVFFAIQTIVRHNGSLMQELAIAAAREEQEHTVYNVMMRIDSRRLEVEEDVRVEVENLVEDLEKKKISPVGVGELLNNMERVKYGSAIQALLLNSENSTDSLLLAAGHATKVNGRDRMLLTRLENSPVHIETLFGENRIHFFVEKEVIKEIVEEDMRQEIHESHYGEERYVWINEVINYEGGDDYAIRLIHPNSVDTEGMYLSTNTEDVAGNLPYWNELNEIKKNGEVFHTYYFNRMDSEEIAEKISYARLYEPYDWIVATGEPLEDILRTISLVESDSNGIKIKLMCFFILADVLLLLWIIHWQKRYQKNITSYVKKETELDSLTGALSRKAGQAELEEYFANFQKNGGTYMLAMFDVDKFKSINDTFGHATGDKVLRQVSQVILANIRGNDRLIRWGGDEFVVICTGVEEGSQAQVANKLLNCIRALQMGTVQQPIRVTLSMGFTSFAFSDKNYQQTMERVDEALYHSKATGRNRYTQYERMIEEQREKEGKQE